MSGFCFSAHPCCVHPMHCLVSWGWRICISHLNVYHVIPQALKYGKKSVDTQGSSFTKIQVAFYQRELWTAWKKPLEVWDVLNLHSLVAKKVQDQTILVTAQDVVIIIKHPFIKILSKFSSWLSVLEVCVIVANQYSCDWWLLLFSVCLCVTVETSPQTVSWVHLKSNSSENKKELVQNYNEMISQYKHKSCFLKHFKNTHREVIVFSTSVTRVADSSIVPYNTPKSLELSPIKRKLLDS